MAVGKPDPISRPPASPPGQARPGPARACTRARARARPTPAAKATSDSETHRPATTNSTKPPRSNRHSIMFSRAVPRLTSLSASRLAFVQRALHSRVPLDYPIEAGVGNFLSPKALNTVAVDWQDGLLNKLNTLTRGQPPVPSPPTRLGSARAGRGLAGRLFAGPSGARAAKLTALSLLFGQGLSLRLLLFCKLCTRRLRSPPRRSNSTTPPRRSTTHSSSHFS